MRQCSTDFGSRRRLRAREMSASTKTSDGERGRILIPCHAIFPWFPFYSERIHGGIASARRRVNSRLRRGDGFHERGSSRSPLRPRSEITENRAERERGAGPPRGIWTCSPTFRQIGTEPGFRLRDRLVPVARPSEAFRASAGETVARFKAILFVRHGRLGIESHPSRGHGDLDTSTSTSSGGVRLSISIFSVR